MKRALVLAVLACVAVPAVQAQCRNNRYSYSNHRYQAPRWNYNRQPVRYHYQPVRYHQARVQYQQPQVQYHQTVQYQQPIQYHQPQVTYQQPVYSQPMMSQGVVMHSAPLQPVPETQVVNSVVAPPAAPVATAANDIVDTAVGAGSFNTLVAAVKAAGLVETLKGPGPFTVFAPTDDAFAKLPAGTVEDLLKPENKDKLVAILTYHVVPGTVRAADVVKLNSAKTVQGQDIAISTAGGVMVNNANVVKTDIECSNGVVHVIDNVILPPADAAPAAEAMPAPPAAPAGQDIVDTAVGAGSFNTLVAAVKAAGLVDTLKGDGPFTVFAPTDDAFKKLPAGTVEDLLKPENKDKLTAILTYHVVPGKVMAADVVGLTEAATVNGKAAPITAADGKVTVGGANVIKTDIGCSNGVIHVIDSVILP